MDIFFSNYSKKLPLSYTKWETPYKSPKDISYFIRENPNQQTQPKRARSHLRKPIKQPIKEAPKNKLRKKRGRRNPSFGLKTGDRSTGPRPPVDRWSIFCLRRNAVGFSLKARSTDPQTAIDRPYQISWPISLSQQTHEINTLKSPL